MNKKDFKVDDKVKLKEDCFELRRDFDSEVNEYTVTKIHSTLDMLHVTQKGPIGIRHTGVRIDEIECIIEIK